MSGLLAGCHAIAFDGSRVMNLDGFAAVPSGEGELAELPIPFGDELVVYAIGPASCAVPGLPAALGELWERLGGLPWKRLCEPALELARTGVPLPEMHARTLAMLSELLLLERGGDLFGRDGHVARRRRRPPPAGARPDARGSRRRGRSERLQRLHCGSALADRRSRARRGRPRELSRSLARIHARRLRGPAHRNSRRALGRPGAASSPPTTRRPDPHGARARARRGLRAAAGGRRAHDQHGRGRRTRARVRPHALARRGRRRLAAGLRRAAQQPPRRVRHRLG